LAKARKRLPDATFHESLIEDLSLSDKFGTVVMLNILEHVIDPVVILRKAAGFLEKDGVLIVQVPNASAVNRKIAVLMGTLTSCEELSPFDINVAGHRRSYTIRTLVEDAVKAGLRVASTGGVFYKSLSTPQIDWLLSNGPWERGEFGWGRVGAEPRDWRSEFCRACYEFGKDHPEDCNVIYACLTK
jgi:2-polyprenyl-3-methyl-5-hydroxy-6-metoxy-1,4-benzoquinol methylase